MSCLYINAHIGWLSVTVCSTIKTQLTNFSFQALRKSVIFIVFFGLYRHFFQDWMGALSLDRTRFFYRTVVGLFWLRSWRNAWHQPFGRWERLKDPEDKRKGIFSLFFGCVLEETHDNTYLEDGDERKVLKMKGKRCFNFKVIVISLYVIKNQWKIKFNNKRYIICDIFLLNQQEIILH